MLVKMIAALSATFLLMAALVFGEQPFLCRPIRPGERVEHVALSLTGRSDRVNDPRFQIVDSATSRVVPKAHYALIRPGYLACVETGMADDALYGVRWPGAAVVAHTIGWAGLGFLITLLGCSVMQRYSPKTRRTIEQMNRFGDRFLREFARPLARDNRSAPPLRFRVRCLAHRDRMEVFIAPENGHRYPNLSDHRTNVEYDIDRITRALRDESFVSGEPYAHGSWVVIPFELKPNQETEGAA